MMAKADTAHGAPWWLDPGPENCADCEVAMHFDTAIYCIACDRPFCSLCVVGSNLRYEYICKSCAANA